MRVEIRKAVLVIMLVLFAHIYAIQNPINPLVNPSSYYGPRSDTTVSNKNHQGFDYPVKKVKIFAVSNGKIKCSKDPNNSGRGLFITLADQTDNSKIYNYYHLSDTTIVSSGTNVIAGDSIGITGKTGAGNSWHLHFQVDQNGQPHHPLKYLPYTQGDYISHRVMEKDDESFTIKFITTPPFVDIDQIRFTIMQANNIPVDCVIALSPYDISKLNPTNGNPSIPTVHPIGNTSWTYELKIDKKECI